MYVCQARYDEIIAPAVRGEPRVRDDVRCVSIDYTVDALTYIAEREREREIPLGACCVYRLRSISLVDRERTGPCVPRAARIYIKEEDPAKGPAFLKVLLNPQGAL